MAIGKLGKYYQESLLVQRAFISDGRFYVTKFVAYTAMLLAAISHSFLESLTKG